MPIRDKSPSASQDLCRTNSSEKRRLRVEDVEVVHTTAFSSEPPGQAGLVQPLDVAL